MPFPLLPVAIAAGAAYVLFSGKKSPGAPPTVPSSGGGSSSPSTPAPPSYVPPSSGGGGGGGSSGYPGYVDPSTGQYVSGDPNASVTPGGTGVFPNPTPSGDLGGAASSSGADASNWFDSMVSGPPLVWSNHVQGWVPYYAGYELGHPPPHGLPIYG